MKVFFLLAPTLRGKKALGKRKYKYQILKAEIRHEHGAGKNNLKN